MTDAPAAPLDAGVVLEDRFEIVEFLGAGSFGAVYRAKQTIFGHRFREVALKLFKAGVIHSGNARDVFRDAILLASLQEENPSPEVERHLVQVLDVGVLRTPEPRAFMSLRLVKGHKTLENVVARYRGGGGMPVPLALSFLRQILVPLAWMHTLESPVVHGDLKPDNVLLADGDVLVLTDFGLAAHLPLGALGGAIQYQAPETLMGLAADAPADVYGAGLVLYEMLTGRRTFEHVGAEHLGNADTSAYVQAHLAARRWPMAAEADARGAEGGRIPPPRDVNRLVRDHPQVEAMLARCLAYRPSDRYPNASLLLADVDRYLKQGTIAAAPPAPARPGTCAPSPGTASAARPLEAVLRDAEVLAGQGRPRDALDVLEGLLRREPTHLDALMVKARVLARTGRSDEAKALVSGVMSRTGPCREVLLGYADVLEISGNAAFARSLREQATRAPAAPSPSPRRGS